MIAIQNMGIRQPDMFLPTVEPQTPNQIPNNHPYPYYCIFAFTPYVVSSLIHL